MPSTILHCVALRTVRYSDRHSILTAYSAEAGRVSLLVPAGGGRGAARIRALTMPMGVLECVVDLKAGRDIYPFKDLTADASCLQGDYGHPVRGVLGFFLADFFYQTLKEPMADAEAFGLVRDTSRLLWTGPERGLANLHLLTMVRAATVYGIRPDTTTAAPGRFFDMAAGVWHNDVTLYGRHCLNAERSEAAQTLLRITPHNYHLFRFNRTQRAEAVDTMVEYFRLHGFERLDSDVVKVLGELL